MWHTPRCFAFRWLAQLACWHLACMAWPCGSICCHRNLHGWSWSYRWSWACRWTLDSGTTTSWWLSQHLGLSAGQHNLEWISSEMGSTIIKWSLGCRVGRPHGISLLLPSPHATQSMSDLVSSTRNWHGWWPDCSTWTRSHLDSSSSWTGWW